MEEQEKLRVSLYGRVNGGRGRRQVNSRSYENGIYAKPPNCVAKWCLKEDRSLRKQSKFIWLVEKKRFKKVLGRWRQLERNEMIETQNPFRISGWEGSFVQKEKFKLSTPRGRGVSTGPWYWVMLDCFHIVHYKSDIEWLIN